MIVAFIALKQRPADAETDGVFPLTVGKAAACAQVGVILRVGVEEDLRRTSFFHRLHGGFRCFQCRFRFFDVGMGIHGCPDKLLDVGKGIGRKGVVRQWRMM